MAIMFELVVEKKQTDYPWCWIVRVKPHKGYVNERECGAQQHNANKLGSRGMENLVT